MLIHKLTAYDLSLGCFTEEAYFTSKRKAEKSMEELRDYLIWNHHLHDEMIDIFENTSFAGTVRSWIIGDKYNISLVSHRILKDVLRYT